MKESIDNQYSKLQYYTLCCLVLFPILPRGIHSIILVIMTLSMLVFFVLEGFRYWNAQKTIQILVFGTIFFIFLISILYSSNYQVGLRYLQKMVPIFLVPLLFLSSKRSVIKTSRVHMLFKLYIVAIVARLITIHIVFFEDFYTRDLVLWEIRNKIEVFSGIHGTYLSMWIGFGVLLLVSMLRKTNTNTTRLVFGVVVIMYLIYWQLILGSRMALFATIISAVFLLLRSYKLSFMKISILSFISLLIMCVIFQTKILSKIEELSNYKTAIPVGKYEDLYPEISNENIRSVIYHCAITKSKDQLVLGYGIGDVDETLQECYDTDFDHTDVFERFHYNSHSQYILVLMATGLIGLFTYLFTSFIMIRWSLVKTELYTGFLILMFFCFLFENILSRHDGIMLYSIFNSILFFAEKEN